MCDITPTFHDFCNSKSSKLSPSSLQLRNRKAKINKTCVNETGLSSSESNLVDHQHQAEFLDEAYRILSEIMDLKQRLEKIKPAYLNVSRTRPKFFKNSTDAPVQLTDNERDEIDIQTKAGLNRCLQAIFRLESSEKNRIETLERKKPKPSFMKLFPAMWTETKETSLEWVSEMRTAITWSLNKRAMAVSDLQKELQHARLARELDRQETFAWKIPAIEQSAPSSRKTQALPVVDVVEEAYDFSELEPMQIQALERENKELMVQFESSLQQVMQAERSLLEISNMQTTLATHIELQAREAERLYLDAQDSNDYLGQGNQYLKSATSNAAQSRHFLFIFFMIASATLLFLDWYD